MITKRKPFEELGEIANARALKQIWLISKAEKANSVGI